MGQEHSVPKDTPPIEAPKTCPHCGKDTVPCPGGMRCPSCALRWEVVLQIRQKAAAPLPVPHFGNKHYKMPEGIACRTLIENPKWTTDVARVTCLQCRRAITRMKNEPEEHLVRLTRHCRHCRHSINVCGAQRYCYDRRSLVREGDTCEHFEF